MIAIEEKIVNICGVTVAGLLLASQLKKRGCELVFLDNDPQKEGIEIIDGIRCYSMHKKNNGLYIIAVKSPQNQADICEQLKKLGIESIRKLSLEEQNELVRSAEDRIYIECMWLLKMGYSLQIDNPRTFNEKIQWLKLYDRNPIHTTMVDKYKVKDYVTKKIGNEYVVPILGVWDSYDEIDFERLPERFVLKCNHDSGSVVVCTDKNKFDSKKYKDKFESALKRNYFYDYREWPYKDVPPKIMAEQYIDSGDQEALLVYKFLCFNGEPKILQLIQDDKHENESIDYFDMDWNLLELTQNFPNSRKHLEKPVSFEKMKELARTLSKDEMLVRVDFYEVNSEPLFSEFTFYSDAGFEKFNPPEWDKKLGDWLILQ